ncbi:hypothetical protein CLF_112309, partial [Clonorchis sinensis]
MEAWYSTTDSINRCIELDHASLRAKDQLLHRNNQEEPNIGFTNQEARNCLGVDQQRSRKHHKYAVDGMAHAIASSLFVWQTSGNRDDITLLGYVDVFRFSYGKGNNRGGATGILEDEESGFEAFVRYLESIDTARIVPESLIGSSFKSVARLKRRLRRRDESVITEERSSDSYNQYTTSTRLLTPEYNEDNENNDEMPVGNYQWLEREFTYRKARGSNGSNIKQFTTLTKQTFHLRSSLIDGIGGVSAAKKNAYNENIIQSKVFASEENPVDLEYADDIVLIFKKEKKAQGFLDELTK